MFLLCLACLMAARPAAAVFMTGGDLTKSCAVGSPSGEIYRCLGYIAGVIDYHVVMQSLGTNPSTDFCLPESITIEQAAIAVLAYIKTKPEHASFIAAPAVALALNKLYPCASVR